LVGFVRVHQAKEFYLFLLKKNSEFHFLEQKILGLRKSLWPDTPQPRNLTTMWCDNLGESEERLSGVGIAVKISQRHSMHDILVWYEYDLLSKICVLCGEVDKGRCNRGGPSDIF
jgi:hypothetical protein